MGGYFTAVISRNLVFNIRQEVFAKLLRLPSQYYLDNTSGHITAKIMYNVEQLTAASTEALRTLLQQGLISSGIIRLPVVYQLASDHVYPDFCTRHWLYYQ